MLDQSGSITTTDPGNLRLQAAKIFLGKLGTGDQVACGAFASAGSLPYDITHYQDFTTDGRSLFPTIDALASKEGGGTPLYKATVAALRDVAEKGPTANKAALIFTDGEDTGGGWTIDQVIAEAKRLGVPLHMVGLGKDTKIDVLARMAYATGGSYMQAIDAGQLIALYGNLGALLRGSTGGYRTRWTRHGDARVVRGAERVVLHIGQGEYRGHGHGVRADLRAVPRSGAGALICCTIAACAIPAKRCWWPWGCRRCS